MKKFYAILILVGFLVTQAYASSETTHKPKELKATLEQQLAKYISYPEVMKPNRQGGIVVIQFRVNEDHELCQLEVFSQNEQLNHTLLRQLTGKKLRGYGSDASERYTVRLHFRP